MSSLIMNIIGNIILFVTFGVLFPRAFYYKLNRLDKLLFVPIIGIVLIEISQFIFKLRVFDIDDIILNNIGVLIGFAILKKIE